VCLAHQQGKIAVTTKMAVVVPSHTPVCGEATSPARHMLSVSLSELKYVAKGHLWLGGTFPTVPSSE
jgi:hypothetical protein